MAEPEETLQVQQESSASTVGFNVDCPQCLTQFPDPMSFGEDGDLILEVGDVQCYHIVKQEEPAQRTRRAVFEVCSKTLSHSSPVMKEMMCRGIAESNSNGDQQWELDLREDDPEGLVVLLNIMHLRFDLVPTNAMDLEALYHIAVLAYKYDLAHLLRPWRGSWAHVMSEECEDFRFCKKTSPNGNLEKRVLIDWVIRSRAQLNNCARCLAWNSGVGEHGALVHGATLSPRFGGLLEPPELLRAIDDLRYRCIRAILTHTKNAITSQIEGKPSGLTCRSNKSNGHLQK
ncbi:Uu.00g064510.m01.CDS01 [Anthostomella pinea]|uniref:Uu.00g064510.m01.CDS01 n=1 Tax=Anthostomella pinea TaxID=933095 RepID=A0AAI8VMZ9_9PEZI|nr:Uu.00g064510.m01.CDS01 [Anthostomella pinea]